MSRVGKIARLPQQIREQINFRLQDGEEGKKIIAWLNSLDEVKTILSRTFDKCEVTDGNLCEWKKGGYREWQEHQLLLTEARRDVAEGVALAQDGQGERVDGAMGAWMLSRYISATRRLLENSDDPAVWKLTRQICHDMAALRRGEHGEEWLRLAQERLEFQRQKNARGQPSE